jgi:hypothetical protein
MISSQVVDYDLMLYFAGSQGTGFWAAIRIFECRPLSHLVTISTSDHGYDEYDQVSLSLPAYSVIICYSSYSLARRGRTLRYLLWK